VRYLNNNKKEKKMSHFENYAERVRKAEAIYNGQFYTKSAKKDAMEQLNRAYSSLKGYADKCWRNKVREELGTDYDRMGSEWQAFKDANPSDDTPYDLHNVREAKHAEYFSTFGNVWIPINNLVELRAFFKEAEIVAKPKKVKTEGVRTERSAKYWGHCQICQKRHKIDVKSNKMADHGYTVSDWRSGSCKGSHALPLELSCDLVKEEIVSLKEALAQYQEMERQGKKVFEGLAGRWDRLEEGTPIYGEPSKYIKYCEQDITVYEGVVEKWYALNLEDLEEVLYD
jgi:hypothetical protein|tara:strand:+ start:105 stop:959 length:855 start_codon:yes stop_codon:yes gene_type:complete